MGTYLLKAEDATLERWKAAASTHGLSFAEYLRQLLDHGALPTHRAVGDGKRSYKPDPKGVRDEKPQRGGRR